MAQKLKSIGLFGEQGARSA